MKKVPKIYRQGDVLIREVNSLPKEAKGLDTKVLAYGESTGHSHRFQEGAELYGHGEELYMKVYQPTYIENEETKGLRRVAKNDYLDNFYI